MNNEIIDKSVVELEFDNRDFEKRVSNTIETIKKLKSKINFKGFEHGANRVSSAVKKIDFNPFVDSIVTVKTEFSAMRTVAAAALMNITNDLVVAGKRIAKSLTIAPIHSGFREYELKMGSMQTIMASTGESISSVNKYLNELNEYSDKTIYSFSDMTNNIGKFTNAGVKLETAVAAIKGISNVAAISGANSNEASRAMYNFAQALSSGAVKLIDWKSIELANMATNQFKKELISTAVQLGVVQKAEDGMYKTTSGKLFNSTKNFNDTLQEQWMTTDVLINTLKRYADETTDIGKKASKAAQDVKTWTMLKDTVLEAIQSGWAQSWEIMVGDLNEAKALFTDMSDFIGGIVAKVSGARNKFLTSVFSSSWDVLKKKIQEAGISLSDFRAKAVKMGKASGHVFKGTLKDLKKAKVFEESLEDGWLTRDIFISTLKSLSSEAKKSANASEDLNKKLKKFQRIVDDIWAGKYKNGEARVKALTEAGYNYAEVQDLVNKSVGDHKITIDDLGAKQLKSIGYTNKEIKAIRALAAQAKDSGSEISELIDTLYLESGRDLLIDTVSTSIKKLQILMKPVREEAGKIAKGFDAWGIRGNLKALNEFVHAIEIDDASVSNFARIVEGLGSMLQLSWLFISANFTTAVKLLRAVLDLFGTNIVTLMGRVADYIVIFHHWVDENTVFTSSLNKVANIIVAVIKNVKDLIGVILGLDRTKELIANLSKHFVNFLNIIGGKITGFSTESIVDYINNAFKALTDLITGNNKAFKEWASNNKLVANTIQLIYTIITKVINGLDKMFDLIQSSNFFGKIKDDLFEIFTYVKDFLRLDEAIAWITPENVGKYIDKAFSYIYDFIQNYEDFAEAGRDAIRGFVEGFKDETKKGIVSAVEFAKALLSKIKLVLGIHSPSKEFFEIAVNCILGFVEGIRSTSELVFTAIKLVLSRLIDLIKNDFSYVLDLGVSGFMLYGANKVLKNIATVVNALMSPFQTLAKSFNELTKTFEKFMHTARISLVMFTVGSIFKSIAIGLVLIAGALLLFERIKDPFKAIGIAIALLTAVGLLTAVLAKAASKFTIAQADIKTIMLMVLGISGAVFVIGAVFARLSKLDFKEWVNASIGLASITGGLFLILKGLEAVAKAGSTGGLKGVVKVLGTIVIACLILGHLMKVASKLDPDDIVKMAVFSGGLVVLFGILAVIGSAGRKGLVGAKRSLIGLAGAIAIMVITAKIASGIQTSRLLTGIFHIGLITILLAACVKLLKSFNGLGDVNAKRVSNVMLGLSGSLIMISLAMKILATMSEPDLKKAGKAGIVLMAAISGLYLVLSYATSKADEGKGKVMAVTSLVVSIASAMVAMATAIMVLGTMDNTVLYKGLGAVTALSVLIGAIVGVSGYFNKGLGKLGPILAFIAFLSLLFGGIIYLTKTMDAGESKNLKVIIVSMIGLVASLAYLSTSLAKASSIIETGKVSIVSILKAIGMLSVAFIAISGILYGIGFIAKQSEGTSGDLNTVLDYTIPVLEKIGLAIGGLIGGFLGGLASKAIEKFGEGLETLGKHYSRFMTFIKPGLLIASNSIPEGFSSKMGELAGGIAHLLANSVWRSWFQGNGKYLPDLGTNLGKFSLNIGSFPFKMGSMPYGISTKCESLANGIEKLVTINTSNGQKLEDFAPHLSAFMTGISGYISGANSLNPDAGLNVSNLTSSIQTLTELEFPDTTGWDSVGAEMGTMGESLKNFATTINDMFADDGIGQGLNKGISVLGDMSSAMSGGILDWSQDGVSWNLIDLNLKGFSNSISNFAKDSKDIAASDADRIKIVKDTASEMYELIGAIPPTEQWELAINGSSHMAAFGENANSFITSLKEYATKAREIDKDDVAAIGRSVKAAKKLTDLNEHIPNCSLLAKLFGDFKDLGQFGIDCSSFVSSIATASQNAETISAEQIDAMSRVVTLAENMAGLKTLFDVTEDGKTWWGGSRDLAGLGNQIVQFFQSFASIQDEEFEGVTFDFMYLAQDCIYQFIRTLKAQTESSQNAVHDFMMAIDTKISSELTDIANGYTVATKTENVGGYIVDGFKAGIEGKEESLLETLRTLCKNVIDQVDVEFKIGSPSKVFAEKARWCMTGFTNEIYNSRSNVEAAVGYTADGAVNSLTDTASRLNAAINSGMDFNPVIRPLVDASNITAAASYMNDAFASPYANVYSADFGFNSRVKPLTAADVASQIASSRSNGPATQYNYTVNGITYDDGSGVARALDELARQIKIERRV